MSSQKKLTADVILARALEMFNEQGIQSVGVREIARDLNLSPGNVTYHYAKKEDLVLAIARELSDLNSQTIQISRQPQDLVQFLEMFRALFENQYRYRCLVLSVVHVMEHYSAVAEHHKRTQTVRTGSFRDTLCHLRDAGSIRGNVEDQELDRMAAHCSLVGRFWLSEYWLSDRSRPLEDAIRHYQSLLASVLLPYVTPTGRTELAAYL